MTDPERSDIKGIDNGLRGGVFLELVNSAERLTPSQLGDRLDSQRQQVKYHLDILVERGLVVADDGEYYCQPVFIDPEFENQLEDMLGSIAPEVEKRVYAGEDPTDEQRLVTVMNCLTMALSLELFVDEDPVHE